MSCNFDLLGHAHKKLNLEFTELQFNVNQAFWEIMSLPKLINVLFQKIVQTHIGDISNNYIFLSVKPVKPSNVKAFYFYTLG